MKQFLVLALAAIAFCEIDAVPRGIKFGQPETEPIMQGPEVPPPPTEEPPTMYPCGECMGMMAQYVEVMGDASRSPVFTSTGIGETVYTWDVYEIEVIDCMDEKVTLDVIDFNTEFKTDNHLLTIDGDTTTFWTGNPTFKHLGTLGFVDLDAEKSNDAAETTQWIKFDLGEPMMIKEVRVYQAGPDPDDNDRNDDQGGFTVAECYVTYGLEEDLSDGTEYTLISGFEAGVQAESGWSPEQCVMDI